MKASTYFNISQGILSLVLLACTPQPTPSEDSLPQAVRSSPVHHGVLLEGQEFLAEVVPALLVKVIAQVPGAVAAIPLEEGEKAKRGTPLVHVSAPDIAARVSRVRSERKRAERERDFVCGTLDTDRNLAKSGDLTKIHLRKSERACDSAKLAVTGARAAEREASVNKSRDVERAPFDGIVLKHLVDEGQTVMPGAPLMQFGSQENLLKIRIPQSDLEGVTVGTQVKSSLGDGKVQRVGSQALGPGRVVEVHIQLEKTIEARAGSTAKVTLVKQESKKLTSVPNDSIGGSGDAYFIYVIEKERLKRVNVELGISVDGWTAIAPALDKDVRVALGAMSSLNPQRKIMVVEK